MEISDGVACDPSRSPKHSFEMLLLVDVVEGADDHQHAARHEQVDLSGIQAAVQHAEHHVNENRDTADQWDRPDMRFS